MYDRPGEPTLGSLLREARVTAGLTIRQLEQLASVGRMTISRLENDALVDPPSAADLSRIARSLELNEAQLFAAAGVPIPSPYTSLDVMLHAEYDLPPEAIARIKRDIQQVIDEYS